MAIKNDKGVLISYECEDLINKVLADCKEFRRLKYVYAACRMEQGVKIIFDYTYDIHCKDEMQHFEPLKEGEWFEKTTLSKLLAYLTRLNNITNHYDNIFELFNASGMTVTGFAKYIGAPLRTVQSWIYNEYMPNDYIVSLIENKMQNDKII